MAEAIRDRFANVASIETVQSSANALTYGSLATNMGFLGRRDQALAMAIDEIQYSPSAAAIAEMTATTDKIFMAITDNSTNASLNLEDLTERSIVDFLGVVRQDFGTAAGGSFLEFPMRKQFFPPLITAARTLYLAIDSTGLASAITGWARILFRVEVLEDKDLIELSEVFRLTG